MRPALLRLMSVACLIGFLICLGYSVRSVRYVNGQYLPTHNGRYALTAALFLVLFILLTVRAKRSN